MHWLAVFIGGGIGSVLRYGISRILIQFRYQPIFPLATLLSNVLACILMAFLLFWINTDKELSSFWRLFWMVGICGGFSTFSTFSFENWMLYKDGHYGLMLFNILLSVAVGILIFVAVGKRFVA